MPAKILARILRYLPHARRAYIVTVLLSLAPIVSGLIWLMYPDTITESVLGLVIKHSWALTVYATLLFAGGLIMQGGVCGRSLTMYITGTTLVSSLYLVYAACLVIVGNPRGMPAAIIVLLLSSLMISQAITDAEARQVIKGAENGTPAGGMGD